MLEHGAGVDEYGVSAHRAHDGHAGRRQALADVFIGPHAVAQVVVVDDFLQSLGNGLEIAAGQSAIGGKSFGQYQPVARGLRQFVVIERQPAADIGKSVLLGRHRHAVGLCKHVAHDVDDGAAVLAALAALDEPGIFGEAAAVDVKRLAVSVRERCNRRDIFQADRLPAAGIVGHGEHHAGRDGGIRCEKRGEPGQVHVALERMQNGRILALVNEEINRLSAARLDIASGGVEMRVGGNDLAGSADDGKQNGFRRPALMRRNDMLERHQRLDGRLESIE